MSGLLQKEVCSRYLAINECEDPKKHLEPGSTYYRRNRCEITLDAGHKTNDQPISMKQNQFKPIIFFKQPNQ